MHNILRLFLVLTLPLAGFANNTSNLDSDLQVAEGFLDAFYRFDQPTLADYLQPGADADQVLYYQAWAEAAHYKVKQRNACIKGRRDTIICAITVTDDFGSTLGYEATDTFTLKVTANKISAVSFEGDDPPIFEELFLWIWKNRPEVLEGPCKDLFDGGNTPKECARAVVSAAKGFVAAP